MNGCEQPVKKFVLIQVLTIRSINKNIFKLLNCLTEIPFEKEYQK